MKIYKNILTIAGLLALLLFAAGCERDYDAPGAEKIYTDADFTGNEFISIAALKEKYSNAALGQGIEILDSYVIKGKVISTDEYGNVYRTMYIQDATAGIEVKIGTSAIFNEYRPGQSVYIKLKHLVIGNYRYMLSIGAQSSDPSYANGYIDVKAKIDQIFFKGNYEGFTSADTTVVDSPAMLNDNLLGSLVRLEGLTSRWGTWDSDNYPSFLESVTNDDGSITYTNYGFLGVTDQWKQYLADLAVWEASGSAGDPPAAPSSPRPGTLEYPTWAFRNDDNNRYYGSAWFRFGTSDTDPTHNLIVRSSGYSKFALDPLPGNGTTVDITAIYTKYSSSSGSYITYQLLLNNVNDVVVR